MKANELFRKTRLRLTLTYAAVLTLLLFLFTALAYFIMTSVTYHDQRLAMQLFVEQDWNELKHHVLKGTDHSEEDDYLENGLRRTNVFYVVVKSDGTLLAASDYSPVPANLLLEKMQGWHSNGETGSFSFDLHGDKEIHVMVAVRALDSQASPGTMVYYGKDITTLVETLKHTLEFLLLISFLFSFASAWSGYVLAGKAMKPIRVAVEQQKRFAADASHEFRTPLSIFQTTLELIEMEDGKRLSDFSLQAIGDLKDELKRTNRLVENLLFLARSDHDELRLQYEASDLNEVMMYCSRLFTPVAKAKGIELTAQSAGKAPITADREKLMQMLYILLDNAVKYTREGGKIFLSLKEDDAGAYMLQVRDTGIGIARGEIEKIFERFYRVDKSRSRTQGSTGLGLSIASWIAEMHGGAIEVESEPGEGTTFQVRLPKSKKNKMTFL